MERPFQFFGAQILNIARRPTLSLYGPGEMHGDDRVSRFVSDSLTESEVRGVTAGFDAPSRSPDESIEFGPAEADPDPENGIMPFCRECRASLRSQADQDET